MSRPRCCLELINVRAGYGRINVLHDVCLEVGEGAIVALLGANGAGKTTLLRTISGVVRSSLGSISFRGEQIQRKQASQIVSLGISHVPEGREVFPALTVRENLMMGAYLRTDYKDIKADFDAMCDLLSPIRPHLGKPASLLSGGQQQLLAVGRAMMARPKLMLLDEPSLGLSPIMRDEVWKIIVQLNKERGVSVLLVEQNVDLALRVATFAYVMKMGRVALSGTRESLADRESLRTVYLGANAIDSTRAGNRNDA